MKIKKNLHCDKFKQTIDLYTSHCTLLGLLH